MSKKQQNPMGSKKPKELSPAAIIISSFLEDYRPVSEFGAGVVIMTTDEIINHLNEMADLSQDDVNRCLASLGYRPGRNNSGSFGWMVLPIKS